MDPLLVIQNVKVITNSHTRYKTSIIGYWVRHH